jgi:hypothetical protein
MIESQLCVFDLFQTNFIVKKIWNLTTLLVLLKVGEMKFGKEMAKDA